MNSSKRGISFLVVSVIAHTLLKRSAELFTRPRQPWFALRFTVKMVLRGKKALLWPSLMCECIWLFGLQERNVVRNQVSALPITRTRVKTQFHEKKSCKSLYKMKIVFCVIVQITKVIVMWQDCKKIFLMSWIFCNLRLLA